MPLRRLLPVLALILTFLLAGCDHSFPLTAAPTGPIDARLVGDWVTHDGSKTLTLLVRRYDDQHLVFVHDGQLYRAWPSEIGRQPFLTVQALGGTKSPFVFAHYQLDDNGRLLTVRIVQYGTVPETTTTSAAAQEILLKPPAPSPDDVKNALVFAKVTEPPK
jgi:hypothetical protein